MPVTPLPITSGFYVSDSLPISAQECTNWYVNVVQASALSQETLFGTPGLLEHTTTGVTKQVNRGAHVMNGIPYFVNGTTLYRLNQVIAGDGSETFTTDALGTITGTGRVSMSDNGTQLMILVPGGPGSLWVENTSTFTPDINVVDSDFTASGNPEHVVFVDGYFLLTTDTKKFIISGLNDGLSYNALDFGSAETDPDTIVAPVVFSNQPMIGGSETIEGFQNTPAGADFPFQRTGLFLTKGIFAPFSIINASNTFMFIGGGKRESPAIWSFIGNNLQKISTTAIDSILQGFTEAEIESSFAWSYAQKGAYFVGFSLPTTAVVYDTVSQRWHERKSRIVNSRGVTNSVRFRANSFVKAYGRIFCGDSQDGRIGSLEPDVYTEYGNPIIRRVATQPFQNNMKPVFFPSLELTMESGVGNSDVPDPKIRMDVSRDGKTFSDDRTRRIGKVGEYSNRAIWRRNGRFSRFAVIRFTLSDAVKPVIIQLTGDIAA